MAGGTMQPVQMNCAIPATASTKANPDLAGGGDWGV